MTHDDSDDEAEDDDEVDNEDHGSGGTGIDADHLPWPGTTTL